MGSESRPLVTKGIFHSRMNHLNKPFNSHMLTTLACSVPTFDPNIKDQTAIVTGANGISGFYTCSSDLVVVRGRELTIEYSTCLT